MRQTAVFPDHGDNKFHHCHCGCGLKVGTRRIYATKDCESRCRGIGHYRNIKAELEGNRETQGEFPEAQ